MSCEKRYKAKTDGGIELSLTEIEFNRAHQRKLQESAGIYIRAGSVKYPLLKLLYLADHPLSTVELLAMANNPEQLSAAERVTFSSKKDSTLLNALATLTKCGLVRVIPLEYSKKSEIHVKYELTDLGKEWIRNRLKAEETPR